MTKVTKISMRLAKALLAAAQKRGETTIVLHDLLAFLEVTQGSRALVLILDNPEIDRAKKVAIVEDICEKLGTSKLVKDFLTLLAKNRLKSDLEPIYIYYKYLLDKNEGVTRGLLTAALSSQASALRETLEATISKKMNSNVILKDDVDSSLVGGFLLKIDDIFWDCSIKGALNELETTGR